MKKSHPKELPPHQFVICRPPAYSSASFACALIAICLVLIAGIARGQQQTGTAIYSGTPNYYIDDWSAFELRINAPTVPPNATITSIRYSVKIEEQFGPMKPSDFQILLTSDIRGGLGNPNNALIVYDRLGGYTDGGFDDDFEDDWDIELNNRLTFDFFGEPANQDFYFIVYDADLNGFNGIVTSFEFKLNWTAPVDTTPIPAPALNSPANNATSIDLGPTFSWVGNPRANSYRLVVTNSLASCQSIKDQNAEDGPGIVLAVSTPQTNTTLSPNRLEYNKDYYWMIRGGNSTYGIGGYYSEIRKFTTRTAPMIAAPVLLAPSNNAIEQSLNPSFSWQERSEANRYRVIIGKNSGDLQGIKTAKGDGSGVSSVVLAEVTPDPNFAVASGVLDYNTTYFWMVRAGNSDTGAGGDYGEIREFRTTVAPAIAAPLLISPSNNASGLSRNPSFTWSLRSEATTYRIVVGDDLAVMQNIKSTRADGEGISSVAIAVAGPMVSYNAPPNSLEFDKTYYWMVRAGNTTTGAGGEFGEIRSFTTIPGSLATPNLTHPNEEQTGVSLRPELRWQSVAGANLYRVFVATSRAQLEAITDTATGTGILFEQTTAETVFTLPDSTVVNGQTYYWMVRAGNTVQSIGSPNSVIRSFTVLDHDPDSAVLLFTQQPTGNLIPGQIVPISYTATYSGEVRTTALRLRNGQGQLGGFLSDDHLNLNVSSFSHTYNWTVPADLPSGSYQVELIAYLNGTSVIPSIYSDAFDVTNDSLVTSFDDYKGHLLGDPAANGVATPSLGLGVNAANGNFFHAEVDVAPVPGHDIPFAFVRYYNSLSPANDLAGNPVAYHFGHGWTCSYDAFLSFSGNLAEIRWPDGRRDGFQRAEPGGAWSGTTPGNFHLMQEIGSNGWLITTPQSERYYFNADGLLSEIRSVNNHSITIAYQSTQRTITDSSGREFVLHLNAGQASSLDLPDGTSVGFGYDASPRLLRTVIDRVGSTRQYINSNGRLFRILYRGALNNNEAVVTNSYDTSGRVVEQQEAIHLIANSPNKHGFDWSVPNQVVHQSPEVNRTTVVKDALGRAISISEWSPDLVSASTLTIITYQAPEGTSATLVDKITGANGQESTYDFAGPYPQSMTDPVNRTATLNFSRTGLQRHLPVSIQTAAGAQVTFGTSGNNIGSMSVTQPPAAQALSPTMSLALTHDAAGMLKSLTRGGGATKTEVVARDVYGNPTTLRYFTNVAANAYIQETRTYDLMSRLTLTSDTTGLRVYYFYDGEGRLTDLVSGPGTGYTKNTPASASVRHQRWEYDPEGRVKKVYDGWDQAGGYHTESVFNNIGLLYQVRTSDGASTKYTYNEDGQVIRIEDEKLKRTDKVAHQESYRVRNVELASSYQGTGPTPKRVVGSKTDASGRVIETYIGTGLNSNGDVSSKQTLATYQYDKLDRPTEIKRFEEYTGGIRFRRENFTYSAGGRISTITYHDSRSGDLPETKSIETDATGKPIKVTVSRGGQSFVATARYNAAGQLVETVDPAGNVTGYQRDGLGRVISQSDVRGTYTWSYNDAARSVTRTAPDNTTVTTVSDVHGQPVSITGTGINFAFTYDSRGRVVTETWTGGSRTFAYDGSFVDSVSTQFATGTPLLIDYTWNKPTGELTRQTYAGKQIDYSYNGFGDVVGMAVRNAGGGSFFGSFGFAYNATRGTLDQVTYPNGIQTQYGWNLLGELTSLKTFRPGESSNPFANFDLTMDGLGRRTRIGFKQPEGAVFPDENTSLTHTSGVLTSVSGANVASDGRKNLTHIPGHAGIGYDLLDRVTSVGSTTHSYDAARNRMESNRGGTKVRYLQDVLSGLPSVAATMNGSNQVDTTFIHGPGGLLGGITAGGEWKIAHQDFNSNVIAVTNAQAQITSAFAYTPYGRPAGATGDTGFPFQFSGGVGVVTDPEGLVHMRARSYSPLIRQFTSGDLIPGELNRPMSLGRYSFVEGLPCNELDASGLSISAFLTASKHTTSLVSMIGKLDSLQHPILKRLPGSKYLRSAGTRLSSLKYIKNIQAFEKANSIPLKGLTFALGAALESPNSISMIHAGESGDSIFGAALVTANRSLDALSFGVLRNKVRFFVGDRAADRLNAEDFPDDVGAGIRNGANGFASVGRSSVNGLHNGVSVFSGAANNISNFSGVMTGHASRGVKDGFVTFSEVAAGVSDMTGSWVNPFR